MTRDEVRQTRPAPEASPAWVDGIVLAVNCVPTEADAAVPAFWQALSRALAARRMQLVVASTTTLPPDSGLEVIEIPFLLTEFPARFRKRARFGSPSDRAARADATRWYGCSPAEAAEAVSVAGEFFTDLLDTLRPSAVLGWQSVNPVTRALRQCALAADIPFFSGERGWVRNTLMFDLAGNHALSEVHLSLMAATLRERFVPESAVLRRLADRARNAGDLGRYKAGGPIEGAVLRAKLGIPADARVTAMFTHGEPGLNALETPTLREMHGMSHEVLQRRLDAVGDAVGSRGEWLLVQEHPFNRDSGRTMQLKTSERILGVQENVSSLLDAADTYLFTQATLQFDAAFLDKPFGLLAKSPLYRAGEPPLLTDYTSVGEFLDAAGDRAAWPRRAARLRADIAFLYENFLLDIEPGRGDASAGRLAAHLAQHVRPVDREFDKRVGEFLGKWTNG